MNKKRRYFYILIALLAGIVTSFIAYVAFSHSDLSSNIPRVEINIDADRASIIQMIIEQNDVYNTNELREIRWSDPVNSLKITFELPPLDNAGKLRIDFGMSRGNFLIHYIRLKGGHFNRTWKGEALIKDFNPTRHIDSLYVANGTDVRLVAGGPDAFLESNFSLSSIRDELYRHQTFQPDILFFACIIGLFATIIFAYVLLRLNPLKYNHLHLAYVIIFFLFLLAPGIKMLVSPEASYSENRKLTEKPVFSIGRLFEYPKKLTRYFSDNMGFRTALTTTFSYFQFKLFHSSAYPEKVIVGKDSWLYSSDPEISGDYRNQSLYTETQLSTIRQNLEELHAWYAARNIKFYLMITPSKFRIYPEYLPDRIRIKPGENKLDQLLAYMQTNSKVPIVTVHNELIKAKKDTQVFYAHDTHWNFEGGYMGYQQLMKTLQADFPQLSIISPDYFTRRLIHTPNADLSRMLALQSILLNDEWTFDFKEEPPVRPDTPVSYTSVFPFSETKFFRNKANSSLPRLVIYRDSFANLILPFLIHHFSRSVFIWTYEHSLEVTEKEKPDIVIMEIVEYRLDRILEKNPIDFRLP